MKHVTKYRCRGCWEVRDREKDPCPSCHAVTECEAFWPTASAAEIRQMALERGKRIEELETMLGRANDTLLMVGLADEEIVYLREENERLRHNFKAFIETLERDGLDIDDTTDTLDRPPMWTGKATIDGVTKMAGDAFDDLADMAKEFARLHEVIGAAERVLDGDSFESTGTLAERITQHLRNFDVWFKACKRQDARVEVLERDRQTAEARALAAERECERWRHGQPIEGDYVCPNELKLKVAMTFIEAYDWWNHLPTDKQEPEALTAMNTARNALAALENE
jgi:hypothetical protein